MDFHQSISADLNALSSYFASFRLIVIMPFKGNCIKVQHLFANSSYDCGGIENIFRKST